MATLEARLRTLLPEDYQGADEDIQPVPMRSAGLKYNLDGSVAWNQIWGSFCDLAMAGGPPHKGVLLEPCTEADAHARPALYHDAVREICRGINMVTDLLAEPAPDAGWVRTVCPDEAMAGWLVRAIVMENMSARQDGVVLDLPASPHYRLDKEIKNVVTVMAKTYHYWSGHMPRTQWREIATLLTAMEKERPAIGPALRPDREDTPADRAARAGFAEAIRNAPGLTLSARRYAGWQGVECGSVRAAIRQMRLLVAANVLARREDQIVFVPVDPDRDADGRITAELVCRVAELAGARGPTS